MVVKEKARRRRLDFSTLPQKQGGAYLFLQLLQPLAQRRLGNMQRLRRLADTAVLNHGAEIFQPFQIHLPLLIRFFLLAYVVQNSALFIFRRPKTILYCMNDAGLTNCFSGYSRKGYLTNTSRLSGYPRTGVKCELNFAVEAFWKGARNGIKAVAAEIRRANRAAQKTACRVGRQIMLSF